MKKISIIVITYNNSQTISECLNSVFSSNFNKKFLNIIIIDNNSQDNTTEKIEKIISKSSCTKNNFKLLKNKNNIGFAKAVNQGINFGLKNFQQDFFFLLNPDAIIEKNCLKNLFKKNTSTNLLSPKIINSKNGESWFSGGKINWWKMKTCHKTKNLNYLTGCTLLIPQKVIEKIGLFDEKFFLYYEDADFSWRAKKAGISLKIIKEAICFHNESQSFKKNKPIEKEEQVPKNKDYFLVKSGLIFFQKHFPFWAKPYFWTVFYLRYYYHRFISQKKSVLLAMDDFRAKKY